MAKGKKKRELSGYRAMWLFALFDLPVDDARARKEYTKFRKALLSEGFTMMQFSVYVRFCASEEEADVYRQRVKARLPPEGEVRLVGITDRQFAKMQVFEGKKRRKTEEPPSQLALF